MEKLITIKCREFGKPEFLRTLKHRRYDRCLYNPASIDRACGPEKAIRLAADLKQDGRRSIIWHDQLLAGKDWEGKGVIAFRDRWHQTASGIDYLNKIDKQMLCIKERTHEKTDY